MPVDELPKHHVTISVNKTSKFNAIREQAFYDAISLAYKKNFHDEMTMHKAIGYEGKGVPCPAKDDLPAQSLL